MNIWSGSIARASNAPLSDLRLSLPPNSPTPTSVYTHLTASLAKSSLTVLSLIDPSKVPLFLAAGPSLELSTTSAETESYFRGLFLSSLPTDFSNGTTPEQSRVALLVRVDHSSPENAKKDGGWGITELVVYGAITHHAAPVSSSSTQTKLIGLTPPNSSPAPEAPSSTTTAVITVHALPLSSNHAFSLHLPRTKPDSLSVSCFRKGAEAAAAEFIAPNPQDILNPSISNSARKRRADVLDAAVEKQKKPKRSAPPPSLLRPPPLSLLGRNAVNSRAPSVDMSVQRRDSGGALVVKSEARSPSPTLPMMMPRCRDQRTAPLRLNESTTTTLSERERERETSFRPPSAGTITSSRPGTSRKYSGSYHHPSSVLRAKEIYTETETKNREALGKVVVSGMKSFGVRDYRKDRLMLKTSFQSLELVPMGAAAAEFAPPSPDETHSSIAEIEKEYKAVYHQCVKAAVFAFRNSIATDPLPMEVMKDVVDKLLAVLCACYNTSFLPSSSSSSPSSSALHTQQQQQDSLMLDIGQRGCAGTVTVL